ncbi:hypothetical protein ACRYCC_12330 [Actinomadura scrupuli]|uniref:hypothetical protein n=1 Tax=Actinomadura scrupuli TaxID=559629 RepID=UPI003D98A734
MLTLSSRSPRRPAMRGGLVALVLLLTLSVTLTLPAVLAGPAAAGPLSGRSWRAGPHCSDGGGWECLISVGHPGSTAHSGGRPHGPSGGGRPAAAPDLALPDCSALGGAQECLNLPGSVEVAPLVRTADLAAMAMDRIALPVPRPHTSPSARTWIGLRTFLWIDRRLWHPYTAGAAVPGQRVTLIARPTRVAWHTGEMRVECAGPGEPYRPGATPGCGYTYRRSSAHVPGGGYELTATVFYTVEWTCTGSCDTAAGSGGPLPATGRTRLSVGEIQTETTTPA